MIKIDERIDGDLTITEDTEILGEVHGDVFIECGEVVVTGVVKGTIYANEDTSLELVGECDEINADAADVNILGRVYGDVIIRDSYLEIYENAIIDGEVIDENDTDGITRYSDYDDECNHSEDDDEDDDDEGGYDDYDEDDDYYDDDDDDE